MNCVSVNNDNEASVCASATSIKIKRNNIILCWYLFSLNGVVCHDNGAAPSSRCGCFVFFSCLLSLFFFACMQCMPLVWVLLFSPPFFSLDLSGPNETFLDRGHFFRWRSAARTPCIAAATCGKNDWASLFFFFLEGFFRSWPHVRHC